MRLQLYHTAKKYEITKDVLLYVKNVDQFGLKKKRREKKERLRKRLIIRLTELFEFKSIPRDAKAQKRPSTSMCATDIFPYFIVVVVVVVEKLSFFRERLKKKKENTHTHTLSQCLSRTEAHTHKHADATLGCETRLLSSS